MSWKLASMGFGAICLSWNVASAQVTRRASVDSAAAQADGRSQWPSMSPDAHWIAFTSEASNLTPGDSNGMHDVFVRDRLTGAVERVSVGPNGEEGNAGSFTFEGAILSADGRFVAFTSLASNFAPGDNNANNDVFVRDRQLGTTEVLSVDVNGNVGNGESDADAISPDGRFVVFHSAATNLLPGGSNGSSQVYLRDRQLGTTVMVSVDAGGPPGNAGSGPGSLTPDGRYVAFQSVATDLVPNDTNGDDDVFVRDLQVGATELVSVSVSGGPANDTSFFPTLSPDGRFVLFTSAASNLTVVTDTNGAFDVFLRDRLNQTNELVSVATNGGVGNSHSSFAAMSTDTRYVVFHSYASDLVPADANGVPDIFVRDRQTGTNEIVSVNSGGGPSNVGSEVASKISDDGRFALFASSATNLVPMDTNAAEDIYLRDRQPGSRTTAFTSLCDPGTGGVIACPCSNAPSGPGRGCDNSSATGGASLSASGNTELSADGLAFTTAGEQPSALSILAQGTALVSGGIVYGQGVRCLGGSIRRLFTKGAVGGTISAPDFPAGDPPVSVRSALKGDVISPGQSRWYLVYYRDPTVLGGCPATSTFNATQTGRIDWSF